MKKSLLRALPLLLLLLTLLGAGARGQTLTTTCAASYAINTPYQVSFSASGFVPAAGNVYTVQISNAAGLFTAPVTIGTIASTATTGNISINLPVSVTAGTGYRMRTLSSSPAITGTGNGTNVSIAAGIITNPGSSNFNGGYTYTFSFSSNFTPGAGNVYTVQLSNDDGSFTDPYHPPVAIGTLSSTATTGSITVTIPLDADDYYYRVRTVSSAPAVTGANNGTDLHIDGAYIDMYPYPTTFIAGDTYTYPFSVNYPIGAGNVYKMQIDYDYIFANPITIATLNSTAGSGTFTVTVPNSVPDGTYPVRLNSSAPSFSEYYPVAAVTHRRNALDFDGVNDYADLGTTVGNFGTGDFTVETWFKTIGTAYQPMISKRAICGHDNFFELGLIANGQVVFQADQNSAALNFAVVYSPATYNDGVWHHAAGTRKGTALSLYIDGAWVAGATSTAAAGISNTANMRIGGSNCGYFKGDLDEVRIWNKALCAGQIQDNMNRPLAVSQTTNLLAYYAADQGTAASTNTGITTLFDSSGNSHNATLNGFALTGATSNFVTGTVTNSPLTVYAEPEVALTGNGNPIANGATPATATNFTAFGTNTYTRSFTISNTGTGPLSILSAGITGTNAAEFAIATAPAATVVAGGSTTFIVTFTALGTGTRTATVAIGNTDCDEGSYTFAISAPGPTITTGTIAGNPIYTGAAVSVPYTITGAFAAGNVFTAQLSNAAGSFATPVNIGTLTATAAGTIAATIPVATIAGTGYRIRVVASTPATTGSDNGVNLNIAVPIAITTTLPSSSTDAGTTFNAGFTTGGFTPAAGNVYTVQLSNGSGSFASPVTIGTLSSTATSGSISVTTPVTTSGGGSNYQVRTVSSAPAVTGASTHLDVNSAYIDVYYNPPVFVAGNGYATGYGTSDYTLGAGNVFTTQLSDATGSFANPVTVGMLSSTYDVGNINITIPAGTPAGTGYHLRVVSSNPAFTGGSSSNITITAATITTTPGATAYVAGNNYPVAFANSGFGLTAANVYTLQLSNAAGSFASPITVGTLSSTAGTGSITAAIPVNTPPGTGYRLRTLSSSPAITGAGNSADITIGAPLANALDFDGANDYADLGTTVGNFGTGDFTVEAWFKTTAGGVSQPIISKRAICNNGNYFNMGIYPNGGGFLEVNENTSGLNTATAFATGTSNDGAWHHMAGVRQGTALRIYIDGVLKGSSTTAAVTNISSTAHAQIGHSPCGYFAGDIDEVRIWNRALCQAELQNNMNGTLPDGQTALAAYYRMDQGMPAGTNTGITTLADASGNGITGVLTNMALTGSTSNFVAGTVPITAAPVFVAPVAAATSTATQTIAGSTEYAAYCANIANITPAGAAPVSGAVTATVTVDGAVQSYSGHAYVPRHYDITPAANAANATANITLYFTQADFTAYNAANGLDANLPTTPSNADTNIGHLRVTQYHGTGTTPGTYSGSGVFIAPTAVVYQNNRWEVTFPVTGFSGFYITGNLGQPLPVRLERFTAAADGPRNRVDWEMGEETSGTEYAITRSENGSDFETISNVAGTGAGSYTFYDDAPLQGVGYYRLMLTSTGENTYSNIATVRRSNSGSVTVAPIPAHNSLVITNTDAGLNGQTAVINDMAGREVYRFAITGSQTVDVQLWAAGIYNLRLPTGEVVRLVKD